MKRTGAFVLLLAVISVFAGYLFSKASLIGRTGISLFYQEYGFLKVWWQGALVVFAAWMLLMLVLGLVQKKAPAKARIVSLIVLLAGLAGLYFTFYDFRHTLTHRLLGERFHLGGYLFWIGWIMICIFFLIPKKDKTEYTTSLE